MTVRTRSRALTWSKECERRARDLYRRIWPEAQRAKFYGREDREGHPDIVDIPIHVQVKARDKIWVSSEFRKADRANQTGGNTHLVIQDTGGPMLVVMRLLDYVQEREVRDPCDGFHEAPGASWTPCGQCGERRVSNACAHEESEYGACIECWEAI